MKRTAIAVMILFASLQLAVAAPAQGKEFSSKEGGFSVMTPVALEEASQEIDTAIGKIKIVMYGGQIGDASFQIGYNDYPKGFVTADNTAALLDGAVQGMVSNIGATLVSQKGVTLKGYPGKELVATLKIEDMDAQVKARIFIVGSRLYQVVVVAASGAVTPETVDAFLQSLKLL